VPPPAASSAAGPAAPPAVRPGRPAAPPATRPGTPGPAWLPLIPALATLAIVSWRIAGPSYERDESATLAAVHRPFGALLRLLGHVDGVHGLYYTLIWVVVRAGGSAPLVTRLPSALAMAAAAAVVAALGRRLVSPAAGLAAGMFFAVLPVVSWYGQDARSYAFVIALAALASYLLVRVLQAGHGRARWLAGYAACVTVLGAMNLFGLLLLGGHLVTVAWAARSGGRATAGRRLVFGWATAVAAALAVLSPLVALAYAERYQIGYLRWPGTASLMDFARLAYPLRAACAVAVIIAGALAVSAVRDSLGTDWPPGLVSLCVPWLAAPPLLLLASSAIQPVFTGRYIAQCVPAIALLAGAALATLGRAAGWPAAVAALAAVTLLALPSQLWDRASGGHGDDIHRIDQIIAVNRRPGDGLLYGNRGERVFAAAYPYGLASLRDVALARTPAQSGTLAGADVPGPVLRARLGRLDRVWVLMVHGHGLDPALRGLPFRLAGTWHVTDLWLMLYTRGQSPSSRYVINK
jgi:mannosyltransferase